MSILAQVRRYLENYPGLEGLGADCLQGQAGDFSLDAAAGEPVLARYLDGSEKRQARLVLRARRGYGADTDAQLETHGWFDGFARWLEEQNQLRLLPELDPGDQAVSFLPEEDAAVETVGEDGLCFYQMGLRLVFVRE